MVSPTGAEEPINKEDQQNTEESSTSDQDTENTEESSNSETSEAEPSTFDVVMNAIKPDEEDDEDDERSSEEDKSKDSEGKPKDDTDDSDEPSEEELKAWKPKTRERFEKLQGKYREASERLEKAEVDAGHYRNFVDYLDTNRITQDEANELFDIGALMKNDPAKALQLITPHYRNLLQITGNILPQDLEQQVNQGYITKAAALEMSRLRASGQTQQAISKEKEAYQQNQTVRQQNEQVASMQSALANWEQTWATSDPDYSVKKDRVLDRVELMLVRASKNGTLPRTVEEAVKMAESAKAEVEKDLKQFKPRKKTVGTVDGGSSSSSLPEPKDTKDVIRRTLNI